MSEIPFWVHDRPKWVSGIGKSTTCQDVLHALVLAERKAGANKGGSSTHLPGADISKKKEAKEEEIASREISKDLVLVEQWRGVERPLSNSSKVVKLWQAWGEERSQVRFVVKRISMTTQSTASGGGSGGQPQATSSGRQTRSRPRRRNSRASATSDSTKKATDTVHPSALSKPSHQNSHPSTTTTSSDLERLMRIILTQGETIHWQLKKLQDREGQIESIEHEVHQSRTKTAGKDYLLNAYLSQDKSKQVQSGPSSKDPSSKIEATTEGIHDILEALGKVFSLNEKITEAEEKAANLENQLTIKQSPNPDSPEIQNPLEVRSLQGELKDLRTSNDQAGREIDQNRHLISSMRLAYDERKALMAKLEKDVDTIELEGQRLQKELQAIQSKRQEQTFEMLSSHVTANITDMDLDGSSENSNCENHSTSSPIIFSGGFLDSACQDSKVLTSNGHYQDHHILTSEQLYEGPQQEPGALYDELQRRLRIGKSSTVDPNPDPRIQDPLVYQGSLHDPLGRLGLEDCLRLQSPDNDIVGNRIKATGSPGSNSSSGNSSGSGASYEKSVRFNDRQLILSTPELPDLAPVPPTQQLQQQQQRTKSILKPGDTVPGVPVNGGPGDNTDSNSDTGLSSLHSSSDEGTYVLDTLV